MRFSLVKLQFALAFLFISSIPAAAQHHPMPGSDQQPPVKCTGCIGENIHFQPNDGLPTVPYSAPIVRHVGRTVDASSTRDFQHIGFRTARAGQIMSARTQRGGAPPRIYMRIGEAIFAWRLDTFFTQALPGGMKPINAFDTGSSYSGRGHQYEKVLLPEAHCYPEASYSGWKSGAGDDQATFGDMDFDDRGYVYTAMTVHGWGVLKDSGETGVSLLPLVSFTYDAEGKPRQMPAAPVPPDTLVAFKGGSKYYVAISELGGLNVMIYDVTSPSTPVPVLSVPREGVQWGMKSWAKNTAGDRIAYIGGGKNDNMLLVYDGATYVAGGAPLASLTPNSGRRFRDLVFDESGNIWIAEGHDTAPLSNVLRRLTPSGGGYVETTYNVYGEDFSPQKIHVSDGYIAMSGWGIGSDGKGALDVKIFKIEGSTVRQIDVNKFFSKYYHRAPVGYAQPPVFPVSYMANPGDSDVHVVKWQGKLYLIYHAYGMGDVYELESGGSITAQMKTNAFGTRNPYLKEKEAKDGPFPGDIVTFNGTSSVPNSGGLLWDFGNIESGTGSNIGNSTNGADIKHQYTGLSTAAAITATKTVTIYEANDQSIVSTLPVNLKVPTARIALPDGTSVTGTVTGVNVVHGDVITDGSDGSVESHFTNWTVNGVPYKFVPTTPVGVGEIGTHHVTLSGSYGKYDPTTRLPTHPPYNTPVVTLTFTVRPFLYNFKAPVKSGNAVRFGATARRTSDVAVLSAQQWTTTWTLKQGTTDVAPPQTQTVTIGSIPDYVVTGTIPTGSVLELTVTVDASGLSAPAQQFATYSTTMILESPDPKITMSGCTNALGPCSFTAGSVGAKPMTDWTLAWSLLSGTTVVGTGSDTTYSPTIDTAGTYTIRLKATKGIFESTVELPAFTVAPAVCGTSVPADSVLVWSSCTSGCDVNTDITFRPDLSFYTPQECDKWEWDFGDGTAKVTTTGTDFFVKHKFATNRSYTVRLRAYNSSNPTGVTVTKTISVGSTNEPPPPVVTCNAATSISFTYNGSKGCRAGVDCKTGESITFTPRKNNLALQNCDQVSWDFGDGGSSSTSKGPSRTYTAAGNYTVTLNLSNEKGTATPVSQTIKVVEDTSGGCTRAVTNVDFYLFYLGRESGCSYSNDKPCKQGEIIDFKALPFFGYTFQTCDRFEWKFGDGTTSSLREPQKQYAIVDNFFTVSLRVYNTLGEGTLTHNIRFDGAPAEPAPVLTAVSFPATGAKGVPVTFTVESNLDTTTGWSWDFNDGTARDDSQAGVVSRTNTITHTFASAGTYNVTVQARNSRAASAALTAAASGRIVISDIPQYTFLLPAVIHDDGQNGSKWRTDVQVYYSAPNPAATPLRMTATFNGANTDLVINQSTFIFEDFMTRLTSAKAQGPVIVTTLSAYKPQIWTRTYNVDASGKTFGQFIPAVELTGTTGGAVDGSAEPERYYLSGLRQDSRYRTNVGLINTTTADVIADVIAYDDLQTPLDRFTVTLPPFALEQFSLGKVKNLGSRPVSLEISVPAGKRVVGYASLIDGRSNDPVYISATSAVELTATAFSTSITPGVGHIGDWRSDVTIFNSDDRNPVTFDLEYYDGAGLRRGLATNLTLGPLQAKNYEDLLRVDNLFSPAPPDGVGMLRLVTRSNQTRYPLTFSRTYNDKGSGGTFGQGIPGIASLLANVKNGKAAVIPGVRSNENYKTNIGLTNTAATAVSVRVQLLDPNTGASIPAAEQSYTLPGYASIVGEFNFQGLQIGTLKVEITGGDGAVWAFCSVIDKNSQDPEYVPAVPLP